MFYYSFCFFDSKGECTTFDFMLSDDALALAKAGFMLANNPFRIGVTVSRYTSLDSCGIRKFIRTINRSEL